jgi:enoyl-CoA hydratase/carnithine racemase
MGGGLALAMACDLRYCSTPARFRMPAARLGLGYGYYGIQRMVNTLGEATVADLFFTARTFDGVEAQRLRLVHDAYPAHELDAKVEATLAMIAANAPLTVRLAKQAISLASRQAQADCSAQIEQGRALCLQSADYAEGRRAFAEKRAPHFTGQ